MMIARSSLIKEIIIELKKHDGALTDGMRTKIEQELVLRTSEVSPIEQWSLGDLFGLAKFYGLINNNYFQAAIYDGRIIFYDKKSGDLLGRIDLLKQARFKESLSLYKVLVYKDMTFDSVPVCAINNVLFPNYFFKKHLSEIFISKQSEVDEVRFSFNELKSYKYYVEEGG